MSPARTCVVVVGGAIVIGPVLSACGSSPSPVTRAHRAHATASPTPAARSGPAAVKRLRIPKRQSGELARATITPKGQRDVLQRDARAVRYAVRVSCVARGRDAKAAYVIYDTDTSPAKTRKLTSGGFPCDGTEYENSIGRLHTGVQVAFTTVPRHVVGGYAIVVPE